MQSGNAAPLIWDDRWVTTRVRSQAEADHAKWLFRLGYDLVNGTPEALLIRNLDHYDARQTSTAESGG